MTIKKEDLAEKRRLHEEGLRRCIECEAVLPLSAFSAYSRDVFGLQTRCRPCLNGRHRELHAARQAVKPRRSKRLTLDAAWTHALHDQGLRWCAPCARVLPESEFGPLKSGSFGLQPACRECTRRRWRESMANVPEVAERRRQANRRRNTPERQRRYTIKRYYGLTPELYDELLTAQVGVCAICQRPETRVRGGKVLPLHVDHCHDSKKVRGLLCGRCNTALGMMDDDPDLLIGAAAYLRRSRA